MNRLSYPAKFFLLFVIVLIPMLGMGTILVKQFVGEVNYLEGERLGLDYIKLLRLPIEHIQQHRGMTNAYRNGAEQFKERIIGKRQEIDTDFAELARLDQTATILLKTAEPLARLRQQWTSVQSNAMEQELGAVIAAHNALIADGLDLITHIANTSGIVLDPKLDSFHLGFALTVDLPQLIEFMGQTRALASGAAAKGQLSPETKNKLLLLMANIDTYARKLDRGLRVAAAENPEVGSKLQVAIQNHSQALQAMQDLIRRELLESDTVRVGSDSVFQMSTDAITQSYRLYNGLIQELSGLFAARADAANQSLQLTVAGLAGILIAVVLLLAGLTRSVNRNITLINSATQRIARNDLTVRLHIESEDEMREIGKNFNAMVETSSALLRQIMHTSSELHVSSEQVYNVASQSAAHIDRQRQETASVATAVTEMSATIHDVAATTSNAAQAASSANEQAKNGKNVVQSTTQAISQLARDVEAAANVIRNLEKSSESIGALLDVIKSIAEQTNLLALNAAIEAARAGEHGRGFAVVADEVRSLASRTQESTATIENMIAQLQSGTREAVRVMQQSCSQAQIGVERSQDAMAMLESIGRSVATIDAMNLQIASAAEQQSAVTEEINRNIIHITSLSEQTATGAEQTTQAASHLNRLAENLNGLINQFKIGA
ncbi:methyl-accepting chemotaxis protein [Methylomonas sp. SURF-1]|uniref:Methyl-accepting chemotaxis protein n=1 Tax=Methylomonas aurea TaxID=2952224 RepID=A0ABT1UB93_9GAMM|nr:methyl-accepting chemotaxis protein [Methylomonas sp. SURF-1]MCQ8179499.1 methyl-accepting chemotaxis protein [Methylomonas sp. SURF-1]